MFYHAVRRGTTVRRLYLGDGPMAKSVSESIEQRKQFRESQRQALADRETQYRSGIAPLDTLETILDGLVGASLLMSGHHRHDRGEWRRKKLPRKGKRHGRSRTPPGAAAPVGAGGPR